MGRSLNDTRPVVTYEERYGKNGTLAHNKKEKSKKIKLTLKQKRFADAYLEDGNGTRAIIKAGYNVANDRIASSLAVETKASPSVIEYLRAKAPNAAARIVHLSENAENENVSLNASRDILDRVGFGTRSDVHVTSTNINVDLDKDVFSQFVRNFGKPKSD